MRLPDSLVEKLLLSSGKFSKKELTALRKQELLEKRPLQDLVIEHNLLTEEELTKLYAAEIGIPFIEFEDQLVARAIVQSMPERVARRYGGLVFNMDDDGTKLLAIEDPGDVRSLTFLQKQLGNNVKIFVTSRGLLQAAFDRYYSSTKPAARVISVDDGPVFEEATVDNEAIEQTIDLIIEHAIAAGASAVHIEPHETFIGVRYRIGNLLQEANKLPLKLLTPLVGQFKTLAKLDVGEQQSPQSGGYTIKAGDQLYDLRVTTLPVIGGEKIGIRILNKSAAAASLSKLGLWGETLADLHNAIVQPNGLVLVCGPTWSGKSSTLFSILSSLNTPNINIATLEDPIEYRIAGANQTQVNPGNGITFSSGMEALLLQDPNVIMISAITSGETARLAIEAASSGRLVLSSLHTKTAASALAGLGILGIEPYLIASTVRMTIAQRLVRRLCKSCRESYKPDSILLGHLAKNFDITTYGGFKRIHSLETAAHSEGLGDLTEGTKPAHELGSSATTITRLWKPHNGGCDSCNHSGYQGHIGLYESIVTTSAIQKLIVKNSPAVRIEEAAGEESMVPLRIDGLIKALRGLTTIDEVLRVTA